jgi:Ni,Fe-hydrogenase I cytochrome b subunit
LAQQSPPYRPYVAWDLPTRLFHWINALAVISLLATGIAILSDDALGFSVEGKVLLKSVHVSFGYVMALNLLWRFVWAFLATNMQDGVPYFRAVRDLAQLQGPMRRPSSLVSHSNMWGITRWRASESLCSFCFC